MSIKCTIKSFGVIIPIMESGSFEETTPSEIASSFQPWEWTCSNDASRIEILASSIEGEVVFSVEAEKLLATGNDGIAVSRTLLLLV